MNRYTPDFIHSVLQKPLPGHAAHLQMAPPWRKDALRPEPHYRPSAILLLLFPELEGLAFPLIRRSRHLNHHANQIGFPGGALETDETAEAAALRETEEELGIPPEPIRILGHLSPLGLANSGYTIFPVVGFYEARPTFIPNQDEVDHWFIVPLTELLRKESVINLELEDGREVPAYQLNGEAVWGATAMILAEFVELLKKE
uniref:CoA pyrophosphatase n=1 Tax=Gracilinema caldarium TaxID=215591 RepID=A0A7C3E098_9SPIR